MFWIRWMLFKTTHGDRMINEAAADLVKAKTAKKKNTKNMEKKVFRVTAPVAAGVA
jgi:hypothetical protein